MNLTTLPFLRKPIEIIPNDFIATDGYVKRQEINGDIIYYRIKNETDLTELSVVKYYICKSNYKKEPDDSELYPTEESEGINLPALEESKKNNMVKNSILKEDWDKYNLLGFAVKIVTTLKRCKYEHDKKQISVNHVDTVFIKGINTTSKTRNKFFTKKLKAYNLYVKLETGLWYFQTKKFENGKWQKTIKGNIYRDIFPPMFKDTFNDLSWTITRFLGMQQDNDDYVGDPIQVLFLWVCKFHKVRLPNNYKDLMIYHPGLKYMRKYPKYIEAILRRLKIFSGLTNKLIHEGKDPMRVLSYYKILGDLTNKIDKDKFNENTRFLISPFSALNKKNSNFKYKELKRTLTNHERLRVIKCINDGVNLNDIIEHFDMLDRFSLDNNLPTIYLKANSNEEFQREHNLFSRKITIINDEEFELEFDKIVLDAIDNFNYDIGEAYLLKNKHDYIEEGDFQHHCVSYYHEQYKECFIVSVRFRDKTRITCEIDYKGNIRQARGITNKNYLYDNRVEVNSEDRDQYKEDTVLELQERLKLGLKKYEKNYNGAPILRDYLEFPRPKKKIIALSKEEKLKQLETYFKND